MIKKISFVSVVLLAFVFSQMTDVCLADVSSQLEQAQTYQKDGQYEQVEAIYKAIVTDSPGTDFALTAQKELVILYILTKRDVDVIV